MNQYELALETIKHFGFTIKTDKNYKVEGITNLTVTHSQEIALLEKLAKKETPVLKVKTVGVFEQIGACGICGVTISISRNRNYCGNCGNRIAWGKSYTTDEVLDKLGGRK